MRWRQLYYMVSEFDRVAGTLQEALRRIEAAVEQRSQEIEAAASKAPMSDFGRIADALELLVAAQIHRRPIKHELDGDETVLEVLEREEAHRCPICRRVDQETAELLASEQARAFLFEQLKAGEVPVERLFAEAAKVAISRRSLWETSKDIGVVKSRREDGWVWSLNATPADRGAADEKASER